MGTLWGPQGSCWAVCERGWMAVRVSPSMPQAPQQEVQRNAFWKRLPSNHPQAEFQLTHLHFDETPDAPPAATVAAASLSLWASWMGKAPSLEFWVLRPAVACVDAARTSLRLSPATGSATTLKSCIGNGDRRLLNIPLAWKCPEKRSYLGSSLWRACRPFAAMQQIPQRRHVAAAASRNLSIGMLGQRQIRNDAQEDSKGPPVHAFACPEDLPDVAHRVFEAAGDTTKPREKDFWSFQREEALQCIQNKQLPPFVVAQLMTAFAMAGELSASLATTTAECFCTALRDTRGRKASSLLLQEWEPEHGRRVIGERRVNAPVDFSAASTLLVAIRNGGLLEHPTAGRAARALQDELLLCIQSQCDSLTFSELRRALLLLGVTAEVLGLKMAAARELFTAAKKLLRKMRGKGRIFDGGDARDSFALLWPLAGISAAMKLPPPQNINSHSSSNNNKVHSCGGISCSSREELEKLRVDRDILLQLLKTDVSVALSSRLPCSPLDLALGFIGLERLGQHHAAEYVLAAFSAAAATADGTELCRLGKELLLTGNVHKTLWDAFADAAAAVLQQQQQNILEQQQAQHHHIAKELAQWLRFCGRIF